MQRRVWWQSQQPDGQELLNFVFLVAKRAEQGAECSFHLNLLGVSSSSRSGFNLIFLKKRQTFPCCFCASLPSEKSTGRGQIKRIRKSVQSSKKFWTRQTHFQSGNLQFYSVLVFSQLSLATTGVGFATTGSHPSSKNAVL